jgi:hypothetical protein
MPSVTAASRSQSSPVPLTLGIVLDSFKVACWIYDLMEKDFNLLLRLSLDRKLRLGNSFLRESRMNSR